MSETEVVEDKVPIDHGAERAAHEAERAAMAKQRERVEWVVHDKATGRVLRRGRCSRENMNRQALHDGEGVIELAEDAHTVTANSHEVDVESRALIPRRRVLQDEITAKRRDLATAFDAAVQADFNAMAHTDDGDPVGEFRKKRLAHRGRLNSLNILLDGAQNVDAVAAISW